MSITVENIKDTLTELLNAGSSSATDVVHLVDGLFVLCAENRLCLELELTKCLVYANGNSETAAVVINPLRKSQFRAVLARIATLCSEHSDVAQSLYGCDGEVPYDNGDDQRIKVSVRNTPDLQFARLEAASAPKIVGERATNPGPNPVAVQQYTWRDWQDAVTGLIVSHRDSTQPFDGLLIGSCELSSVNPESGCEVVLKCGESTYRGSWNFNLAERTFSASCNCGHQDLCEHTYLMAVKLKQQLDDPRSELVVKILGEEIATHQLKKSFPAMQSSARIADVAALIHAYSPSEWWGENDSHWNQRLERLREVKDTVFHPPLGLKAHLRDYQLEGFRWMCRLAFCGIGGILADDMGLGKTIQTLAVLLTRATFGPTLIIAPASLCINWQRECERFAPSLRAIVLREISSLDLKNHASDGVLMICSYSLALRDADVLRDIKWGTMILDEAQSTGNRNSRTAAQIRTIQADWKLAITSTPMENHLGELWSIFHTVAPGLLGSWTRFRERFAAPIEKDANSDRREALAHMIAPCILRRTREDVVKELPDRTETNLVIELSAEEHNRYEQMQRAAIAELNNTDDEGLSQDHRLRLLQMLMRMRQLSCHIGLVDDTWKGSSAKLDALMEILERLKKLGSRPLVYSHFSTYLRLIRSALDKAGITYQYLDGQTTAVQRKQQVQTFQSGESDAFLILLKAGGTGLNLTAADSVIYMDPWWNPVVEDQATDRVRRIAQPPPVNIYRIIARGTVEEKILAMADEHYRGEGVMFESDVAANLAATELADLIRNGL